MNDESEFAEFRELAEAVGYTTILWSQIERQLDNWVLIAYNRCGGKSISDEIPRAYAKKHVFLKKAFKLLPALAPFSGECLELLGRINALSELRHILTHGTLESLVPENGVFTFRRMLYGARAHQVQIATLDLRDWPPIFTDLRALMSQTSAVSSRLLQSFPKKTVR